MIHTAAGLRRAVAAWRAAHPGDEIALVPTMGALHEGHLALVDRAHAVAGAVIVSIFVNPTQFAANEDFGDYPRTLGEDVHACGTRGVRWVFAPSAKEMYPPGDQTEVTVPTLAEGLCGTSRPHFFGGVARVVLKLLNIAGADFAVFGEKDYQQLQVIRRLAEDLHHPTRIVGAPTVRESDGLAMSSRNRYLTPEQRQVAPELFSALTQVSRQLACGDAEPAQAVHAARQRVTSAGMRVDYLHAVDAQTLAVLTDRPSPLGGSFRVVAAVWLGTTRLIDNVGPIHV
ncbi:MAG: pantoate--beta-alanine ligase [Myxococcales bacterium]|nr:pantoate--beta-alanine ligase [Myxococcales bacterium]